MTPLSNNKSHSDVDAVVPSLSKFLGIHDQVVRLILAESGLVKSIGDGKAYKLDASGLEYYKSMHLFDNNHFEDTLARLMGRRYFMKKVLNLCG